MRMFGDPDYEDMESEAISLQQKNKELQDKLDKISEAATNLNMSFEELGGCSDGYCVIRKPKGMHTNGGCNCYKDKHLMQIYTHRMSYFRHLVDKTVKEK